MRIRPGSCASVDMAVSVLVCCTTAARIVPTDGTPRWRARQITGSLPYSFHGFLSSDMGFGRKSLCAKPSAALRCSPLPACGGGYAADQLVRWGSACVGMFSRLRVRPADWEVRSDSSGIGGGPRVDGD